MKTKFFKLLFIPLILVICVHSDALGGLVTFQSATPEADKVLYVGSDLSSVAKYGVNENPGVSYVCDIALSLDPTLDYKIYKLKSDGTYDVTEDLVFYAKATVPHYTISNKYYFKDADLMDVDIDGTIIRGGSMAKVTSGTVTLDVASVVSTGQYKIIIEIDDYTGLLIKPTPQVFTVEYDPAVLVFAMPEVDKVLYVGSNLKEDYDGINENPSITYNCTRDADVQTNPIVDYKIYKLTSDGITRDGSPVYSAQAELQGTGLSQEHIFRNATGSMAKVDGSLNISDASSRGDYEIEIAMNNNIEDSYIVKYTQKFSIAYNAIVKSATPEQHRVLYVGSDLTLDYTTNNIVVNQNPTVTYTFEAGEIAPTVTYTIYALNSDGNRIAEAVYSAEKHFSQEDAGARTYIFKGVDLLDDDGLANDDATLNVSSAASRGRYEIEIMMNNNMTGDDHSEIITTQRFDIEYSEPSLTAMYPLHGYIFNTNVLPEEKTVIGNQQPSVGVLIPYDYTFQPPVVTYTINKLSTTTAKTAVYKAKTATGSYNIPIEVAVGLSRRFYFEAAEGSLANAEDGTFNWTNVGSGKYEVITTFYNGELTITEKDTFEIAKEYDLRLNAIVQPNNDEQYYEGSMGVSPIVFQVINAGTHSVRSFKFVAKFYSGSSSTVAIDSVEYIYNSSNSPVKPQTYTDKYREFSYPVDLTLFKAGSYRVEGYIESLIPSDDLDLTNNTCPAAYFTVSKAQKDYVSSTMVTPSASSYRYPCYPVFNITNNSESDVNGARAYLTFTRGKDTLYRSTKLLENIPIGGTGALTFDDVFIPNEVGGYTSKLTIKYTSGERTYSSATNVRGGLKGIKTIANDADFIKAMKDLYEQGVDSNVVFELSAESYTFKNYAETIIVAGNPVTTVKSIIPDFRSKIAGVGPNATITFRPTTGRALEQKPININIYSSNGYGIRFGQALETDATFSPWPGVNVIRSSKEIEQKAEYANSLGYIIFDGGGLQNINFSMDDESIDSDHRGFSAPLYLGEGSQNITIKNCRIKGNNLSTHDLPNLGYESSLNTLVYDDDIRTYDDGNSKETYSAGVVVRNRPYSGDRTINNVTYTVDNIVSKNINIDSNIISGFGYGIVSMGAGIVLSSETLDIVPFYNEDNKFNNNYIFNTAKAGIFLGFEKNTLVKNNRISKIIGVSTELTEDAIGIQLGGNYPYTANYYGFHNVGVTVDGNEIDSVCAGNEAMAYGIKFEQSPIYLTHVGKSYDFPITSNDSLSAYNNIIRDFKIKAGMSKPSTVAIGINTTRKDQDDILTPYFSDYTIKNVLIANNTIKLNNPGVSATEFGTYTTGIAIQSVDTYKVFNNAIYVKDEDENSYFVSALTLQGLNPKKITDATINKNSYWVLAKKDSRGLVRFIEMDEMGRLVDNGGTATEYAELSQWNFWTEQDKNSVQYDVTADMMKYYKELNAATEYELYRMKNSKDITKSSSLNGRGEIVPAIITDIDNMSRRTFDAACDIGACEFDCKMYQMDIEVKTITAPVAYKNAKLNEEQVMTSAPVEVKAIIRNNGNVFISDCPIESIVSSGSAQTLKDTIKVSIGAGEEKEISFGFAKGVNKDFTPKTYYDLNITPTGVDSIYKTMVSTVTPKYTIAVRNLIVDELHTNDTVRNTVRFFIPKSDSKILVSAENTNAKLWYSTTEIDTNWVDPNNLLPETNPNYIYLNQDIIAGKSNYDSLIVGFKNTGYYVSSDEGKHDIDILDRAVWEARAIDYSLYKTVFYSDGDDKAWDYWQMQNLINFANIANPYEKRNIVMASQEAVRQTVDADGKPINSLSKEFQAKVLRASAKGANVNNYDGGVYVGDHAIKGAWETRNYKIDYGQTVDPYDYRDDEINAGTFQMYDTSQGANYVAYYYYNADSEKPDSDIAGKVSVVSGKTLERNNIYAALDWRHFKDITAFVGGVISDIGTDIFPIPVKLTNFNANALGKKVLLDWATAFEDNTSNFEIERANIDNNNIGVFSTVVSEKAAGMSNATLYYNAVDNNVEFGNKYAYRIKMNEIDGVYSYSDVEIVNIEYAAGANFGDIVPNPATITATIEYSLTTNEADVSIKLIELSGRTIATLFDGTKGAGSHLLNINVTDLASGTYTVLFNINGNLITKSINVVR